MLEERVGTLFVKDYHEAMVRAIGGFLPKELTPVKRPKSSTDTIEHKGYWLRVPNFQYDMPVVLKNPEMMFSQMEIPSVHVMPGNIVFTFDRGFSWRELEYRVPAKGSHQISITNNDGSVDVGYSAYAYRYKGYPCSLTYTINAYAGRSSNEGLYMLSYLLSCFPPRFYLLVTDSLGVERPFLGVQESANDISDVAEVSDRVMAWSMDITIYGRIDPTDNRLGNNKRGSGVSGTYIAGYGDPNADLEGLQIVDGEYVESRIVTNVQVNFALINKTEALSDFKDALDKVIRASNDDGVINLCKFALQNEDVSGQKNFLTSVSGKSTLDVVDVIRLAEEPKDVFPSAGIRQWIFFNK